MLSELHRRLLVYLGVTLLIALFLLTPSGQLASDITAQLWARLITNTLGAMGVSVLQHDTTIIVPQVEYHINRRSDGVALILLLLSALAFAPIQRKSKLVLLFPCVFAVFLITYSRILSTILVSMHARWLGSALHHCIWPLAFSAIIMITSWRVAHGASPVVQDSGR